jgi:dihydroflavonol-4-reductase
MMNVAITGANGLVGANLCRVLINKGYRVKALYFKRNNALEDLDVELLQGSVLDPQAMDKLTKGVDVMFHAAARITIGNMSYEELHEANVTGTRTVFNAALKNGVKTFVNFSSVHALKLNDNKSLCNEDCPFALDSDNLYERSKAIAQDWLHKQTGKGVKIVSLNPTAILGPNDFGPSLIGEFVINVVTGELPALVEGGYDWVDVRDVAEAAVTAVEKGKDGDLYILGNEWVSLIDITKMMGKINGKDYNIKVYPMWLAKAGIPFLWLAAKLSGKTPLYTLKSLKILNDSNKNISHEKAAKELGYKPRTLQETLKDTMEWFKQHNYI